MNGHPLKPISHNSQCKCSDVTDVSTRKPIVNCVTRLLDTRRGSGWIAWLLGLGAAGILIAAVVCTYIAPPLRVHDEFSYRLSAETLLQGRLANPTPAAWQALQSFHIVMQPSYASKYPLGVGITIALGWLIFGSLHAGSWICCGALVSACTWMLAGVVSRRWAVSVGTLLLLHPFLQCSWSSSLMHGYLPAIGCALLTGSILRLRRRESLKIAFLGGTGIATLALSRPFEGLCCSILCIGILLAQWYVREWPVHLFAAIRIGASAFVPVALALTLIAAQNRAVTGNWWQLPYQLHEHQYGVAPLFIFGQPRLENIAPQATIPALFQTFHAVESYGSYLERSGWIGWLRGVLDVGRTLFVLAMPCVLLFLLSGLNWCKHRLAIMLVAAIGFQAFCSTCVCWVSAHYLAPLLPWLLLLTVIAVRVSACQRDPSRRSWIPVTMGATMFMQLFMVCVWAGAAREVYASCWASHRHSIELQLLQQGGQHLVLVKYQPDHNVHHEWVYNAANPSQSSIVWARFEDGRWLQETLAAYQCGRQIWLVDADRKNVERWCPNSEINFDNSAKFSQNKRAQCAIAH